MICLFTVCLASHFPIPNYPHLEEEKASKEYHGVSVEDSYLFLEDPENSKTVKWVVEENSLATQYLQSLPGRTELHQRVGELMNYTKYALPFKVGRRILFFSQGGEQPQPVLYVQDGLYKEPRMLLDPNLLSHEGEVSLCEFSPSFDGKYLAFTLAQKGSDWKEIRVVDIKSGKVLPDLLTRVKFSGMAWKGRGFYYSAYPSENQSLDTHQKVYYHKIGSMQDKDQLIYSNQEDPYEMYNPRTTEEGELLLFVSTKGKVGSKVLWYTKGGWTPLVNHFDSINELIDLFDHQCYLLQDNQVMMYDLVKGTKTPFLQGVEGIIQSVAYIGGKFFVTTLHDAYSRAFVFDREGKKKTEISLPPYGTISSFQGMRKDKYTFYLFSSFTSPPTIYRYLIKSKKSELFKKTTPKIDLSNYETSQFFATSLDGTKVPFFIVHKKGLKKDQLRPTLLTGYGGFDISYTPSFTPAFFALLEKGGVFALANIRGGGEYGKKWHEGGFRHQKQHSFDDFIAVAETLIKEGYTSPSHLGITGGSNGGLLVAASMLQRPDLFSSVIIRKGVLDMLRFQYFTIGWAWTSEYGNSENQEDFHTLYAYSPLHRIQKGVNYPATLITTADHDNRVVPFHSYKFAATLQSLGGKKNPYLLRVYPNSGHGMGAPRQLYIEEMTDLLTFLLCSF